MSDKFSSEFLAKVRALLNMPKNIEELNEFLRDKTGIIDFFKSYYNLEEFKQFRRFLRIYDTKTKSDRSTGVTTTKGFSAYI